MPNREAMERAAARRQARDNAKGAAKAQADAEAQEIAKITEKQNEDRKSGKTANVPNKASAKSASKTAAETRAKRREEAAKIAEKQAEEDVRVLPGHSDVDAIREKMRSGQQLTLHELNAIAKEADVAIRDDARLMANAVGKVAFEQALGRTDRNRHTRMKRMNEAMKNQREIENAETK